MNNQPCNNVINLTVQLARIEERQISMNQKLDDFLESINEKVDSIQLSVSASKADIAKNHEEIQRYKSDRNWMVAIFSTTFAVFLVWLKTKI